MAQKINKAGMYDLPMDEYHGDCCIGPSLSGSGAVTLIDACPALFWYESYLNPDRPVEEPDNARDFGSALHTMVLEPDQATARVRICAFDDWRTKEARQQREEARENGQTPVTASQAVKLAAIVKALKGHPLAGNAFTLGMAERSLFYRDDGTGIWCKTRPDYLVLQGREQIVQFKTAPSAQPRAFERHAYEQGYMQRAAWEVETVMAALELRAMPDYLFVVQEREPPYLVSVCTVHERALEWGMLKNAKAREIFAECIRKNEWSGYGEIVHMIGMPSYAEFQLEERRERGEFSTKRAQIAADMQRPL